MIISTKQQEAYFYTKGNITVQFPKDQKWLPKFCSYELAHTHQISRYIMYRISKQNSTFYESSLSDYALHVYTSNVAQIKIE